MKFRILIQIFLIYIILEQNFDIIINNKKINITFLK